MNSPCPPRKPSTGCSPVLSKTLSPTYPLNAATSWDNSSWEKEDSCTGRSLFPSTARQLWPGAETFSGPAMQNGLDLMQRDNTFGKKTPESPVPNLKSENSPCVETQQPIGQPCEDQQQQEIYRLSQTMYTYVVTTNCAALGATMYNQFQWSELAQSTGVEVQLVRAVGPGTKQGTKLMLKIQGPSGGMVTEINQMLSSMNSGEPLIFHTSCVGLTAIRFVSSVRVQHCHCMPLSFGSRPTWIPECGTQM